MSCSSACYETRTFTPDGRLIKVATQSGKFKERQPHPACADCQTAAPACSAPREACSRKGRPATAEELTAASSYFTSLVKKRSLSEKEQQTWSSILRSLLATSGLEGYHNSIRILES